jgi:hypothetical protein
MLFAVILLRSAADYHWGAVIIMALTIITLPFQMGVLNSAFTKKVPACILSRAMSLITAVGTLGRILGPLWGGTASYSRGIVWVGMFVVAAIGAMAYVWDYSRLGVPAKVVLVEAKYVTMDSDASAPLLPGDAQLLNTVDNVCSSPSSDENSCC